tara:strand:+ start:10785 stop:10928 length:144 start_codon:yes stop_codon:yes gene_type:complete
MDPFTYAYLGHLMDYDPDVLMAREVKRLLDEDLSNMLPDFSEIQDDE